MVIDLQALRLLRILVAFNKVPNLLIFLLSLRVFYVYDLHQRGTTTPGAVLKGKGKAASRIIMSTLYMTSYIGCITDTEGQLTAKSDTTPALV